MASNKKTTEPIFSNGTKAMWFVDRNCQYCAKYTQYNEKLGRMPSYKCAVQRDIELQECGIDEVSQRSYDACQSGVCPFFKGKDGNTGSKHTEVGHHVAPKAEKKIVLSENIINIREQAEKSIREREAEVEAQAQAERVRAEKEEKDKNTDEALAKAFDRRMQREVGGLVSRKREATTEVRRGLKERACHIQNEVSTIINVNVSSYHIVISCMLDAGDSLVQDCIREIKKRGWYKQRLKKQINDAQNAYNSVVGAIQRASCEAEDLRNMVLDTMSEKLEKDLPVLVYAIKAVLDKNKVKDSLLVAKMDAAWSFFELARQEAEMIHNATLNMMTSVFMRERINVPAGLRQSVENNFSGKKPDMVARQWQRVSELIQPSVDTIAEQISNDKNVRLALEIVQRKLGDIKGIDDIGTQILAENPVLAERYKEKHPEWRIGEAI